jgi:hypothetical protein
MNESLFDLYFQYTSDTEAPQVFHRWSLIAGLGAFLGRRFYFPHGTNRIFPNCYIMLIGNPGTRKSSAIKLSRKILASAGYKNFSADKSTKEKFLLDLEGLPETYGDSYGTGKHEYGRVRGRSETISPADVLQSLNLGGGEELHDGTPREAFIAADEFNEFAGSGNLDFFSLLGAMWDWDDELTPYSYRLKNSKSLAIYQPTISILGGNTHTGLKEGFPVQTIGQGFMSRLLLIYGEPSGRKITFPTKPPAELADRIRKHFIAIQETVVGEASITSGASHAIDMIYRTWLELDDYRLKHYSTRRLTHLIKLILIHTAARLSTTIEVGDVLMANTVLSVAESGMSKALGEFGRSKNSDATQAVMTALYDASKPLTFEDLWKVVSRDLEKRSALADILMGLQQAGKIQTPKDGAGSGFLPLQRPINNDALYVDIKLMNGERK